MIRALEHSLWLERKRRALRILEGKRMVARALYLQQLSTIRMQMSLVAGHIARGGVPAVKKGQQDITIAIKTIGGGISDETIKKMIDGINA